MRLLTRSIITLLSLFLTVTSTSSRRLAVTTNHQADAARFTGQPAPPEEPLSLWYRRPARQWVEALAVGNGRLGAMVFGGINRERLQLNEDTLWAGGPYDPNNPEALAALPEARRLVLAGQYHEADRLVNSKMIARPRGQMPYETIGSLMLSFREVASVSEY